MNRKASRITIATLATIIGLYPILYFLIDRRFGLLSTKSSSLLGNPVWNTAFNVHIVCGGIALLTGWPQFVRSFREGNIKRHRQLGKIYVVSVLLSGVTGFYIAFFATGGVVAATGFTSLALVWLTTTLSAFISIRKGHLSPHIKAMNLSYAACFAAVTLRLWLPLLILIFRDFNTAYVIVAWLCWVPNLLLAWRWNSRVPLTGAVHAGS